MRPKQITISEEKVSQVTEVIEQEYENPFGIYVNKEKLESISSGVALGADIPESVVHMVNVAKNIMEDFRQRQLISKKKYSHAPIKKNDNKSFRCHVKNLNN